MKQWIIRSGIVTMCVLSVFISCSSDDDDDDDPNWALLTTQRQEQRKENANVMPTGVLAAVGNAVSSKE